MKKYFEAEREIPIFGNYDVIVIGGGPAGFSAAVNAGKEGAKTLLIEQSGQLGGVATTGLMSHWTGNTKGGFYEEILVRSNYLHGNDILDYKEEQKLINPEQLKVLMLEMIEEAKVDLLLYTFAADVIMVESAIKGVVIENKSGRQAIYGKVIVDASGDGDIAAKSGARFYKGREYDGKMQPLTIMFKMGGVKTKEVRYVTFFEDSYELKNGEDLQSYARKHIPYPAGHVLIYPSVLPGIVTLNMTNAIKVDGTKAEDLTRAEIQCRKQIPIIEKFLKENIQGFENAYVMSSASIIGVRETRHFIGRQTITEKDILEAKLFDDWAVVNAHFNFDVHNLEGAGLDETGKQKHFKQTKYYSIPYGCFVPEKIEGLLLAGRNISGTHMAHSSYRVMPICVNMGQAVGIAAAISVKNKIKPNELSISQLQDRLKQLGVQPE